MLILKRADFGVGIADEGIVRVSSLSDWGSCPIAINRRSIYNPSLELTKSPTAIIGSIVHAVLERGEDTGRIELFNSLIEEIELELSLSSRTSHLVPLRKTIGESKWRTTISRLESFGVASLPSKRRGKFVGKSNRRLRIGREIFLESSDKSVGGIADQISAFDNGVIIDEYKTGDIFARDGRTKSSFEFQLIAYGLLAEEYDFYGKIRLRLSNGESTVDVNFTDSSKKVVSEKINRAKDVVSRGDKTPIPGVDCKYCPMRLVCGDYYEAVMGWWNHAPDFDIPSDIIGEIQSVSHEANFTKIKLLDLAGRPCVVRGISARHKISSNDVGKKIAIFNISSKSQQVGEGGRRLHPLSFFENSTSQRSSFYSVTDIFELQ